MGRPRSKLADAFRFYQVALRNYEKHSPEKEVSYLESIRLCRDCWESAGAWLCYVESCKGKSDNPLLLGKDIGSGRKRKKWLPDRGYWKAVHESSTVVPDLKRYVTMEEIELVAERCNRSHHGSDGLDLNDAEHAKSVLVPTYRFMAILADRIGRNGQVLPPAGDAGITVAPLAGYRLAVNPEIGRSFLSAVDAIGRLVDASLFKSGWDKLKAKGKPDQPAEE